MTSKHRLIIASVVIAAMVIFSSDGAVAEAGLSAVEELRLNVSALWAEVATLREEVSNHHHGGHLEADHDRIVMDVAVMQHEQHIHHDHTEEEARLTHPYHQLHHSHDALAHINADHNHSSSSLPSDQDEHDEHFFHKINEHSHHDHSHDHVDHSHGHDDHSHGHDDHSHGHDDHSHDHGDHSHDHGDHSHDHGDHGQEIVGHVHVIKVNVLDHGHSHDDEKHDHDDDSHGDHDHDHDNDDDNHSHNHGDHSHHEHGQDGQDHDHSSGNQNNHDNHHISNLAVSHHYHPRNQKDVAKATCDLKPNSAGTPSGVVGNITITQKKGGEGPVYFDLTISGFQVNDLSESKFGFHVHESAVASSGDCGTAAGHFNPHGVVHGGPTDEIRHTGDLGNIVVPADGRIDGYVIVDQRVEFSGEDNIIGKSIVVHAGEDDLGKGGDAGSQATGNAGGRLACCNIQVAPEPRFRFGG